MRRAAQAPSAQVEALPPPVAGLVLNRAAPVQLRAQGAEVLENFIPTQRGIRVRGGRKVVSDIGASVGTLIAFNGSVPALFAASETDIYDITDLDPAATPTSVASSRTSGTYSWQQIGTAGGDYIVAVNGADDALLYNGGTWAALNAGSTPSFTGVGTDALDFVWLYRNRLFFVEGGTLRAWYLPTASIGGAATSLSLAGIFRRGGALMFGGTWSVDTGDGLDDKCVFISTLGEVAVYEGSDPSTASDWDLVGRYDIPPPLSRFGAMQSGGDLLIATTAGIVPLSQVVQKDPAALALASITSAIEPLWERKTGFNGLVKWSDGDMALAIYDDEALSVSLQSGAWARQKGWGGTCGEVFAGQAYVGRSDGKICSVDVGGEDEGETFTARYCHTFQDFGSPAVYKLAQLVRFHFYTPEVFQFGWGIAFDYTTRFAAPPSAVVQAADSSFAVWDASTWGGAVWYSSSLDDQQVSAFASWKTVTGSGYALAPMLQITSGGTQRLDIEMNLAEIAFETGGVVV